MFKKINTFLLENHPLLWNMRIVPTILVAFLFHVLFFIIGIFSGDVVFNELAKYDSTTATSITIFFSILVSVLVFVVWIIYYFRNNAFRDFYPTSAKKLYCEWLIIFIIAVFNVSYSVSFLVGKTIKTRSFLAEKESIKRSDIISMASIFIDGGYNYESNQEGNADAKRTIVYNGKKYPENSLLNRSLSSIDYRTNKAEKKVKNWMQQNDTARVKKLMRDYFAIVNEHQLETNLTPQKWFELTYNYPNFATYETIGKGSSSDNEMYGQTNNFKYYLPHNKLVSAYSKMYRTWTEPIIENSLLYSLIYLALGITMLLFSLRITNRKSWLITIVAMGCLWILTGIFTVIISSSVTFMIFWLAIIIAVCTYFSVILNQNREKRASLVIVNLMLWTIPGFFPIIYGLLMSYYDSPREILNGVIPDYGNSPQYEFLEKHAGDFALINVLLLVILMYFMSVAIRKWKGLPED